MPETTPLHQILNRYRAQYQQARWRRALISGVLVSAIALALAWRFQLGQAPPAVAAGAGAAAAVLGWVALGWGLRQGRISRTQAAEDLDRVLGLEQRLVTAAECLEGQKTSELYPALLADVEAKATSPTTGYPKPWSRTSSVLVALLALLLCWPYQGQLPLGLKVPEPPSEPPTPPPTPPPPSPDQQQQQNPQAGGGGTSNANNSPQNQNQQPPPASANSSGASGQSPSSGQSQNNQSSSQGQGSQSQSQSQGQSGAQGQGQQGAGQQGSGQQQGAQTQQGTPQQSAGQQSGGQQAGSSESANASSSRQQSAGQQQSSGQQGSSQPQGAQGQQAGTPQQATQSQPGQGDQQALKGEIQQLLKEMSGQVKELQGQLSQMEQNPPPPGTDTDPDSLFDETTPLDPLTGAPLPMQLETDAATTKAARRGGGTGKPSGDVGTEGPEQQVQDDAQLSTTPTEQAAVTRQPVPPEYRPVFERLQSTPPTQGEP